MVPATEFGPTYSQQKLGLFSPHHKYHGWTNAVSTETRIVFPHYKYHARTNVVSTRTRIVFPHHKYVADQQPTDRQFRYSNRPIRCSTQLNRYYGHYHEQQRHSRANVMLECMALPTATDAIVVCCYMYPGVVPNEAEERQQQPRYTSGTSRCDG